MSTKITIAEMLEAYSAASQMALNKIPHGPGMALIKMIRELKGLHADYETRRAGLLKEHCRLDASGNLIFIENHAQFLDDDHRAAYQIAYKELLATEIEVETKLENRGLEKMELEPVLYIGLGPLFVEAVD